MSEEVDVRNPKFDVRNLQHQLEIAWKDRDNLKKEILDLRKVIRSFLNWAPIKIPEHIDLTIPEEEEEHWSERSEHFDQIRRAVLVTAKDLIQRRGEAVDYDDVNKGFAARFPALWRSMKNPADTISRRLRELSEGEANFLVRPSQGKFFLGPKIVEVAYASES